MINFFRKICKQLTEDNKPVKYVRYAIDETVLVNVGILLAHLCNKVVRSGFTSGWTRGKLFLLGGAFCYGYFKFS